MCRMQKRFGIVLTVFTLAFFSLSSAASAAEGSPYISSTLGYDVSFPTRSLPTRFNFAIFSVTRGKAFKHNERLNYQYLWAKLGSTSLPTLYMNLNAPYGSAVAGNISTPKSCSPRVVATSTLSTGSGQVEPTVCEGYNYGYNAARDAYAYAKSGGVESRLWWLDIEEANSWSNNLLVNDATIQGAIDYLNTQNIRVGIYSMPYMWKKIAGSTFVPLQTIEGKPVIIPLWLPIGVRSQVSAINTCVTAKGFILGSPIWLVQYEASSTAIDQNIAC
ncbi:MAG: hypothetical protein WAW90_03210 [Minisyncoccia bacterium]